MNYGCVLYLIVWNFRYLNVGTHLFGMNSIFDICMSCYAFIKYEIK